MNATVSSAVVPTILDVAIVGAGFGGLCMAIQLKEAGINNFIPSAMLVVFPRVSVEKHLPMQKRSPKVMFLRFPVSGQRLQGMIQKVSTMSRFVRSDTVAVVILFDRHHRTFNLRCMSERLIDTP